MKTTALIVAAVMTLLLFSIPARAYTPEEITVAIENTLSHLNGEIEEDGGYASDVGITSLYYVAFCIAGRKSNIDFPDDDPRIDAMEYTGVGSSACGIISYCTSPAGTESIGLT